MIGLYLVFGFISLEDDPTSNLRLTDQVYPTRLLEIPFMYLTIDQVERHDF